MQRISQMLDDGTLSLRMAIQTSANTEPAVTVFHCFHYSLLISARMPVGFSIRFLSQAVPLCNSSYKNLIMTNIT